MSVSLAISGPMVGVVIVLEGGYNHKALLSGAMAHLTAVTGLVDGGDTAAKDNSPRANWWSSEKIVRIARNRRLTWRLNSFAS